MMNKRKLEALGEVIAEISGQLPPTEENAGLVVALVALLEELGEDYNAMRERVERSKRHERV